MSRGQHIEFDKEQLKAALMSGLNLNDCDKEDINKLTLGYQEELIDEVDDLEASMNLAAIGGRYQIGPLEISCVLGNLVLLSSINSPLVSQDIKQGDELSFDDCVQAIYVLAKGEEAIAPIMAISQRINDLMILKPLVRDNPEMADKIIAKAEEISKARIKFAEDARNFWKEEFVGYDFGEIINEMINAVSDVIKSAKNLPSDGSEEKAAPRKKN